MRRRLRLRGVPVAPLLLLGWCAASGGGTHHDYVEIGTADFDTLAQMLAMTDAVGLSVEPVKEHLDRLPSGGGRSKVNAALAETDGWAELYVVRPEYMEPQCTHETLPPGLRYCMPWWFRATASLHRPAPLVEVHAGPMALDVQMAVPVQTLTYQTLLSRHNVSSVGLLKVDTEGFDTQVLRQVLAWGAQSGEWPERIQFERNNLTDASEASTVFDALQAIYDCWLPDEEEDVHCFRLRDLAAGRSAAPATSPLPSGGQDLAWTRIDLGDRMYVAAVRGESTGPLHLDVRVGDSMDPWENARCGPPPTPPGITAAWTAPCRSHGRFLDIAAERGQEAPTVEALGVATTSGAWRLSAGRRCCTGTCAEPTWLFEGYDPACEARCRSDPACRFFTIYSSLWCATSAACDEDEPGLPSAITFSVHEVPWLPLPLREARQTDEDWGGEASRAVDGRHNPHFQARSCSHTVGQSSGSWWSATLPARAAVATVRVLNRWDCCHERLDRWEVRIGDSEDPWQNPRCGGTQPAVSAGARRTVACEVPLEGRYLGVVLDGPEPLTLCEVEAFGLSS